MEDEKKNQIGLQDMVKYLAGASSPQKEAIIRGRLQDPESRESQLLQEIKYLGQHAFRDKILEAAIKLGDNSGLENEGESRHVTRR